MAWAIVGVIWYLLMCLSLFLLGMDMCVERRSTKPVWTYLFVPFLLVVVLILLPLYNLIALIDYAWGKVDAEKRSRREDHSSRY